MPRYPDDPGLGIGAQRRLQDFDYANPTAIFFVTICAAPGTAPFSDSRLAEKVIASLQWLRTHRGMLIYSYCLMPDHLHLLLRLGTSGWDLPTAMGAFKSFTTQQSWKLGYRGQLWQDRYYDHVLRKHEDAATIGEYMRQNPVRKGLVEQPEEYRLSGLLDPM
jgi:putative transposase